jgi:hypothetical protein
LSLKGIKSILIRPGAMQTRILEDTMDFSDFNNKSEFNTEFRKFVLSVPKYIGKISTPKDVAQVVLKAGTSKNPKQIYSVNHNFLVTILSYLPSRLKDVVLNNSLK